MFFDRNWSWAVMNVRVKWLQQVSQIVFKLLPLSDFKIACMFVERKDLNVQAWIISSGTNSFKSETEEKHFPFLLLK